MSDKKVSKICSGAGKELSEKRTSKAGKQLRKCGKKIKKLPPGKGLKIKRKKLKRLKVKLKIKKKKLAPGEMSKSFKKLPMDLVKNIKSFIPKVSGMELLRLIKKYIAVKKGNKRQVDPLWYILMGIRATKDPILMTYLKRRDPNFKKVRKDEMKRRDKKDREIYQAQFKDGGTGARIQGLPYIRRMQNYEKLPPNKEVSEWGKWEGTTIIKLIGNDGRVKLFNKFNQFLKTQNKS
jgi:hypothetical protein